MARVNQARVAELIAEGMTPRTAGKQERAERAGFTTYGQHEYAQRVAKAKGQGYQGLREQQAARTEARRTGDTAKLRGGDRPGGTPRKQVHRFGDGRVVVTTRAGDPARSIGPLVTALRRAGRRRRAKFVLTADREHKDGPRATSLTIYGRGGRAVGAIRDQLDGEHDGDLLDFLDGQIDRLGDIDGESDLRGLTITSVQLVIT